VLAEKQRNENCPGSLSCNLKNDTIRLILTIKIIAKSSRVVSFSSYMISSSLVSVNKGQEISKRAIDLTLYTDLQIMNSYAQKIC
jgi:hypothetical protein